MTISYQHDFSKKTIDIIAGLLLLLILSIAFYIYSLGMGGIFHFDDGSHLKELLYVHDFSSAFTFISTGTGGPSGRPIVFLSFLLNQHDWPNNPAGFIYINICIHLLNGILLYWLLHRLIHIINIRKDNESLLLLIPTAIWLTSPLLVSSSLFIIQRMTLLSATFVLLGLLGYLIGRSWEIEGKKYSGYFIQFFSISIGIIFGVFSKENAILLTLYIILIETILLSKHIHTSHYKKRLLILASPLLMLSVYFLINATSWLTSYHYRPFSLIDRLLTEPIVLLDYLSKLVWPFSADFSAFRDDFLIANNIVGGIVSFVTLLFIVYLIKQYKKYPLISFSIVFFYAAHLLESTFLPLELYFDHRNYIPIVGFFIALGILLISAQQQRAKFIFYGSSVFLTLQLIPLANQTSLWGNPVISAHIWMKKHPHSIRSNIMLSKIQHLQGDTVQGINTLHQAAQSIDNELGLALSSLYLHCEYSIPLKNNSLTLVNARLDHGYYNTAALSILNKLALNKLETPCIKPNIVNHFIKKIAQNPYYQSTYSQYYILTLRAEQYVLAQQYDRATTLFLRAFSLHPNIDTSRKIIDLYIQQQLYNKARLFIQQRQSTLPISPITRQQWVKHTQFMTQSLTSAQFKSFNLAQ